MYKSLAEVHETVDTRKKTGFFRKMFSFIGPAYLISIGYMDPGNWATDIAAGSHFGYRLLWILFISNLVALLLQTLSARLGIVRGLDLAQATRESYPKFVNAILYFFAEIAIAACDLAEIIGMAVGLNLLFGIPLLFGVLITFLDTFILLYLINKGIRKTEAFIVGLIGMIGLAFLVQILMAKPVISDVLQGFTFKLGSDDALYIAIGIIGATVMPHNLYLHSSLVQSRKFSRDEKGIREAIRFNFIDSFVALNIAFLINAAILILSASAFHKSGFFNVAGIQDAYKLLEPLLGSKTAPVLFAVSLIAAGQSSTVSGTLAGQIVMEGHVHLRLQPWVRRVITRLLAIIPAVLTIIISGEESSGRLLILSQVILSMQLGFAVIPLLHHVSSRKKMKGYQIGNFTRILSWTATLLIIGLNVKMVLSIFMDWFETNTISIYWVIFVILLTGLAIILLLYITFSPLLIKIMNKMKYDPHYKMENIELKPVSKYRKIILALDFSRADEAVISEAFALGGKEPEYLLIHVVESAGALTFGSDASDMETQDDKATLEKYAGQLTGLGYKVTSKVSFGNPKKQIPVLVKESGSDLLVLGSHGHRFLKDIIYGTTIGAVRHKVNVPVLVVTNKNII